MKLWDRLFRRETRTRPDAFVAQHFEGRGIGGSVSPEVVLSNLAVAARCIGIRSEMLSSVGLRVYRRTADGGRERADDLPLYALLHDQINPNMSAFEGREFLTRELDMHGNAYARIERNARGQVIAIWPEPAINVGVERLSSGRLRYRVSSPFGGTLILTQDEMLHVRGPTRDGILGRSPIQIARGALGLAMAQSETASSFMSNMLRPSGVFTFPERLSAPQQERLHQSMQWNHQGPNNSGNILIMDGGAKFDPMSFTSEDMEFLDSRKLANEDVARLYGVPPTCVGITDKATYSNTEQEARALVQNALGPLAARIEAAMSRCLLSDVTRRTIYIEHDLSSLLRGDIQARFEAYRVGREIGALSPNDIRRMENDPPIPNGDIYHQPANWVPLGTKPAQTTGA